MIILSAITISVVAIFLAHAAKILGSDMGRLMTCAMVALVVASCPMFDTMLIVDRLAAMLIGGIGLNLVLRQAFGRAQYEVLQLIPVIVMEARRGSYRMQLQLARWI